MEEALSFSYEGNSHKASDDPRKESALQSQRKLFFLFSPCLAVSDDVLFYVISRYFNCRTNLFISRAKGDVCYAFF